MIDESHDDADDIRGDETGADETGADETGAAENGLPRQSSKTQRQRSRVAGYLGPLLLVALLLASAGLASWLYIDQYRPDRATDSTAAARALKAASDGAVALLSYAPESMEQDFTAAKSHLTGDFLAYYSQFTHDVVTPAVQQKSVKTSAQVIQSAVAEQHPDSAVVLLFLNQQTASKENPNGTFTASSVKVGLTKVDGSWLISSFDPV